MIPSFAAARHWGRHSALRRIGMGFHKQAGDTRCYRRARQYRNMFTLTTGRCALTTGQLHRMRAIVNHRAIALAHDRQERMSDTRLL